MIRVVSRYRLKAPPGISSSYISPLTSSGQRSRASWASQPQKSATLSSQLGGKTRKFMRTCGGIWPPPQKKLRLPYVFFKGRVAWIWKNFCIKQCCVFGATSSDIPLCTLVCYWFTQQERKVHLSEVCLMPLLLPAKWRLPTFTRPYTLPTSIQFSAARLVFPPAGVWKPLL
jgi:hypothetical protein